MNRNMMQQLQARMNKIQQELAEMNIEATSGGGAVTVIIDGQQKIKSVKISQEVINPEDAEMLEDLVLSAVTEAITKSQEAAATKMGALTGGMKIPGLM